jgi:hypothetical protein
MYKLRISVEVEVFMMKKDSKRVNGLISMNILIGIVINICCSCLVTYSGEYKDGVKFGIWNTRFEEENMY